MWSLLAGQAFFSLLLLVFVQTGNAEVEAAEVASFLNLLIWGNIVLCGLVLFFCTSMLFDFVRTLRRFSQLVPRQITPPIVAGASAIFLVAIYVPQQMGLNQRWQERHTFVNVYLGLCAFAGSHEGRFPPTLSDAVEQMEIPCVAPLFRLRYREHLGITQDDIRKGNFDYVYTGSERVFDRQLISKETGAVVQHLVGSLSALRLAHVTVVLHSKPELTGGWLTVLFLDGYVQTVKGKDIGESARSNGWVRADGANWGTGSHLSPR